MSAAPMTVTASSNIHNFEVPRAMRDRGPVAPLAHSVEETEAETRCQNSDVAICLPPTSQVRFAEFIGFAAEAACRNQAHNRTVVKGPLGIVRRFCESSLQGSTATGC